MWATHDLSQFVGIVYRTLINAQSIEARYCPAPTRQLALDLALNSARLKIAQNRLNIAQNRLNTAQNRLNIARHSSARYQHCVAHVTSALSQCSSTRLCILCRPSCSSINDITNFTGCLILHYFSIKFLIILCAMKS